MARVALEDELRDEMARWEAAGLRRSLASGADAARGDCHTSDFHTNDYLGLARHRAVVAGARAALEAHGAGGRASRLLGGGGAAHEELEREAARWLACERALLYPSGWQANVGLVTALCGRGDTLFSDALAHASLIDAARLSRARVHVFAHNDLAELERLLARSSARGRRIVLTESVFSMDGDRAPLAELASLCARHDARLVVDEAHAAGLLGPDGAGGCAEAGVAASERLLARVVTGGKALGATGALVCGSSELVEHLVNRSRAFVYTTAPSPAVCGALSAALAIVRGAEGAELRARALANARALAGALDLAPPDAAIVPVRLGGEREALAAAEAIRADGHDVRAVRPPTVPAGTSRLRVVCHATHTRDELDALARSIERHAPRARRPAASVPRAEPAPLLVVVGTDTGIGKTVVAALLARALARRGRVRYWKPCQTGTESDTDAVRTLAALPADALVEPCYALPLPASPDQAAAAAGTHVHLERLRAALAAARAADRSPLVVELAGGLLVPYDGRTSQADWLERDALPVVLVARSGLGTLNHTLLTLEALRARHLEPRALFLVGERHPANEATLARTADVEALFALPPLDPLDTAALDRWIDEHDPLPALAVS